MSSIEDEYRSFTDTTSKLVWVQSLIKELHISLPKSHVIWCDNLST